MKDLVLAVDVAKDKSTYGLFKWDDGNLITLVKPFDVKHLKDGFECLKKRLEGYDKKEIDCFMESTGGYQLIDCAQLVKMGFEKPIVVNPLYINQNKGSSLRKTKTDPLDCVRIARTYFEGKFQKPVELTPEQTYNRKLSRLIFRSKDELAKLKTRLRLAVNKTFPELEKIFDNDAFFSQPCLNLLEELSCAEEVAEKRVDAIENILAKDIRYRKTYPYLAREIKNAAKNSVACVGKNSIENDYEIKILVSDIRRLQSRIDDMENRLIELTKDSLLFKVIKSFEGIGESMSAHLTAEIASIDLYQTSNKLVASAGLEPRQNDSGKISENYGHITKRGNSYLRHLLFIAVMTINLQYARGFGNKEIAEYYQKMHSEKGKHHYASMVACMNKLLRKIFYRFKDSAKSGEVKIK